MAVLLERVECGEVTAPLSAAMCQALQIGAVRGNDSLAGWYGRPVGSAEWTLRMAVCPREEGMPLSTGTSGMNSLCDLLNCSSISDPSP